MPAAPAIACCLVALATASAPPPRPPFEIGLGRFRFDPILGLPPLPAGFGASPGMAEGLHLIQFAGPIEEDWLERLGDVGEVLDYVPQHAYLVWLPAGGGERLVGAAHVRAVLPLAPALKLTPQVWSWVDDPGEVRLYAGLRRGPDLPATLARLAGLGAAVERHQPLLGQELALLALAGRGIAALAADPEVVSLSAWFPPLAEGEVAKRILDGSSGTGPGVSPPGYLGFLAARGVDGQGVTVAVIDSGVDTTDPSGHLTGRVVSRLRGAAEGSDGHGHHVAGIVAGSCQHPADPDGYRWGVGVAPGAALLNIPALRPGYLGSEQDMVRDAVQTPSTNGVAAAIASCSWGQGMGVDYTALERLWDAFVRDADDTVAGNQPLLLAFSAGNSGPGASSLTRPHAGKNLIVVGNSSSYRPELGATDFNQMGLFSSRGPTEDGRIKPDLVAPGGFVAAALGGGFDCGAAPIDAEHVFCSGTSMAQPHVAGAAALFFDVWQRAHAGARPSPALVKAALINGARDLPPVAAGRPFSTAAVPNPDEGWGRVDLSTTVNPAIPMLVRDQSELLVSPGQRYRLEFALADPAAALRVSLVWTDAPAAVGASPALVNDLDLAVETRGGQRWVGNNFRDGWSVAGAAAADARNNVENVFLAAPAPDLYVVEVVATSLPGDGVPGNPDPTDQDFGLVVANAELPAEDGKLRLLGGLRCGGRAELLLSDRGTAGSVEVSVRSDSEPIGETIVLAETGSGSGFFLGRIDLAAGLPAADGRLQVADGDRVSVTYVDADDGRGGTDVVKAIEAEVDCRGPVIGNVRVSALTDRSARIEWETDEPSLGQVTLERGGAGGFASSTLSTRHAVDLAALESCGRYFFSVAADDAAGNRSVDDNGGQFHGFTTRAPGRVFFADFEGSDGGFSHFGPLEEWKWGAPLAGPAAAYSGDRLWGTALAGKYAKRGQAAPDGEFVLLSPEIDLAGRIGSRLRLRHWFDIATDGATDDGAWVEVSDGGAWQVLAPLGGYGGTVDEDAPLGVEAAVWAGESAGWQESEFDLGSFDGRRIRIRLVLWEEDDFLAGGPGLYLDDFEVFALEDCRRASLRAVEPVARCGGSLTLLLRDADSNRDPEAVEVASAVACSRAEAAGEPVTLTETGPNSAHFAATLPLVAQPALGDGALSVTSGEIVTVRARDADDGSGAEAVAEVGIGIDCRPPAIGAIDLTERSDRSAAIEWRTDEPATSRVEYGTTPALGKAVEDRTLDRRHRVELFDLEACASYYLRLTSADLSGNTITDDHRGQLWRLRTERGLGLAFADDFELDRGWTLEGEWERDRPLGLLLATPASMDPNAARSRERVLGVDLSGQGRRPGNYEPSVALEQALSPAIDCSRLGSVELGFERWLGVERQGDEQNPIDRASVEVSADGGGSWDVVWTNPLDVNLSDRTWRRQGLDVTPLVAGSSDVRVRFTLSSDATGELMGWQVDDLSVRDPTQAPTEPCGPTLRTLAYRIDDAAGNGNGRADPGETVQVAVTLANPAASDAAGVRVRAASGRPDLAFFTRDDAAFPDIPAGLQAESLAPHLSLAVSPAARCGELVPVTLAASASGADDATAFQLLVGPGAIRSEELVSPLLSFAIPERDATGVVASLNVSGSEPLLAVGVTALVNHPRASDLVITLNAPWGETVTLHNLSGGNSAYSPRDYPEAASPDGPGRLDELAGRSAAGAWTLRVIDAVTGASGTFDGFRLRFQHPDATAAPPGPLSGPLLLVRAGVDLLATWGESPGAVAHLLVRSGLPTLAAAETVATTSSTSARVAGGADQPGTFFYAVAGLDGCGRRGP